MFTLGDLRRKFQSYQFRFRYNVDTNVDVRSLILQLDDPIRSALEALTLNAKKIGLFEDTTDNEGGSTHASPAVHHDPDDTGTSLRSACFLVSTAFAPNVSIIY
ncbi:unnamed protein product [Dibothriocephalus latus]|uniref:Uncharacterized protein n=1 Tax=Dibothriocephalus latus TaxID=60516 RepID=A0A3P7P179_DIBLA|nr:unnamed protein product [Dibothriocephalus latus]